MQAVSGSIQQSVGATLEKVILPKSQLFSYRNTKNWLEIRQLLQTSPWTATVKKGKHAVKSARNKVIQEKRVFVLFIKCGIAETCHLLECWLSLGHLSDRCISSAQHISRFSFSIRSLIYPLIHRPSSFSLSRHSLLLLLFVRGSIYRSSLHLFTVIHHAWGRSLSTLLLDTTVSHQSMNNRKQLPHQGTLRAWNCLSIVLGNKATNVNKKAKKRKKEKKVLMYFTDSTAFPAKGWMCSWHKCRLEVWCNFF